MSTLSTDTTFLSACATAAASAGVIVSGCSPCVAGAAVATAATGPVVVGPGGADSACSTVLQMTIVADDAALRRQLNLACIVIRKGDVGDTQQLSSYFQDANQVDL